MKISIGDILDRYSICKLKSERTLIDCSAEINALQQEINNYTNVESFINSLYIINGKIWDLESDIRKGNENILGLEEVGRRAIEIRQLNGQRVSTKNEINSFFNEGFVETKINHGSQQNIPIIVSLSTVPERLNDASYNTEGVKGCIQSLCEQSFKNYEVHFNVPEIYRLLGTPYIIPQWLTEFQLKYPHLKVYRTQDFGPPTKIVPTIQRVKNPETIIIVVDDDLIYHKDLVQEHYNHHQEIPNAGFGYDGRGNDNEEKFLDLRDHWVICTVKPISTHIIQHYKSGSYKAKYFESDFFDHFLGKTKSDYVLISYYLRFKGITLYIIPYKPDVDKVKTYDEWYSFQCVETFPVIKHAGVAHQTGCNNPEMLKQEERFFTPPIFETWLRNKQITY